MTHRTVSKMHSCLVGAIVLGILASTSLAQEFPQERQDEARRRIEAILDGLLAPIFSLRSIKEMEFVRAHLRYRFKDDPSLQYYLGNVKFSTGGRILHPSNAYTWVHDDQGHVLISLSIDALLKSIGRFTGYKLFVEDGRLVANLYLEQWGLHEAKNPRAKPAGGFSFLHWKLLSNPLGLLGTQLSSTLHLRPEHNRGYVPLLDDLIESYAEEVQLETKAFIILHEIAHHKLVHLLSKPKDKATSRQRELDADDWAFTKMKEMGYPLARLHRVLEVLSILEDIDMILGRLPREAESTHPSWKTRAAVLKSNYDLTWPKSEGIVFYKSFLRLRNHHTGGYRIKDVFLCFGDDPESLGVFTVIGFDGATLLGAIERLENKATIYSRPGDALLKFELNLIDGGLLSGEVSGFPVAEMDYLNGDIVGFKSSFFTHYAGSKITNSNIALGQVMEFTPQYIQTMMRKNISLTSQEESRLNHIEEGQKRSINQLFLRLCKGGIDTEEFFKLTESSIYDSVAKVKKLLGPERSKEYSAALFGHPTAQMLTAKALKMANSDLEQKHLHLSEGSPVRSALPGPVRARPVNISIKELEDVISDRSFYSRSIEGSIGYPNDYEKLAKGEDVIIVDRASGLMWQRSGSSESMFIWEAKTWIERLNQKGYFGNNDWRLPTMEELLTLAECEFFEQGLFISPLFDPMQRSIWSCDCCEDDSWTVDFTYPNVSSKGVDEEAFVRAVRTR